MTTWRTDSRYRIFPIYDIESSRYFIIFNILVLVSAILFCEISKTLVRSEKTTKSLEAALGWKTFWTKTISRIKAFIFTVGANVSR
jgi:hypothetical protein